MPARPSQGICVTTIPRHLQQVLELGCAVRFIPGNCLPFFRFCVPLLQSVHRMSNVVTESLLMESTEPESKIMIQMWVVGLAALAAVFSTPLFAATDCLPIQSAAQHVGEVKCVTGKVVRVKVGARGVHFLDFCEDQAACPFSVVVFASDLKDVGDVRRLVGRTVEIHGPVKLYDGHAEIILNRVSQLSGGSTLIPPLPKNYDVEKQGHFSAGRLRPTRKPKKVKPTPAPTATYGNEADVDTEPQ
jgi:hypothetical protein